MAKLQNLIQTRIRSPTSAESNQRNEPCRRRAFVLGACIVQFPPADRAAKYRHHSVQLKSAFDIGPSVRIWRTIRFSSLFWSSFCYLVAAGTGADAGTKRG